jgi:hypothetical protein
MKVAALIELLGKVDQDSDVLINNGDGDVPLEEEDILTIDGVSVHSLPPLPHGKYVVISV